MVAQPTVVLTAGIYHQHHRLRVYSGYRLGQLGSALFAAARVYQNQTPVGDDTSKSGVVAQIFRRALAGLTDQRVTAGRNLLDLNPGGRLLTRDNHHKQQEQKLRASFYQWFLPLFRRIAEDNTTDLERWPALGYLTHTNPPPGWC